MLCEKQGGKTMTREDMMRLERQKEELLDSQKQLERQQQKNYENLGKRFFELYGNENDSKLSKELEEIMQVRNFFSQIDAQLDEIKLKMMEPIDNICPKCGKKMESDAKFCSECGTKLDNAQNLVQKTPVQKICPSCGHTVKPGAKFCGKCGSSIQ